MSATHNTDDEITRFRINDLNIKGLPGAEDVRERLQAITAALDANVDIGLFQEGFTKITHREAQKFPEHPFFSVARERAGKPLPSGLFAVSGHPIIVDDFLGYTIGAGADYFANKGVQMLVIKHPKLGKIRIANTHLQASYKSPQQYASVRKKQILEMLSQIKRTTRPDEMLVIGGDFNMHEDSEEYDMVMNSGLGLIDVMREASPDRKLVTYDYDNPYACKGEKKTCSEITDRRLDYIMVRPPAGFELDLAQTRISILDAVKGTYLSDHSLLDVDLAIKRSSSDFVSSTESDQSPRAL